MDSSGAMRFDFDLNVHTIYSVLRSSPILTVTSLASCQLPTANCQLSNVYFTSDVDAKNRIRSLNEFSKINLNANRRAGMHDEEILKTVSLVIKSLMIKLHLLIIFIQYNVVVIL